MEGGFVRRHCRGARPPTFPLTSFWHNIYHSSPMNNHPTTWTSIQHTINSNPPPFRPFWLLGYLSSNWTACQQHHHLLRNSKVALHFDLLEQSLNGKKKDIAASCFQNNFPRTSFFLFAFYIASKTLKKLPSLNVWLCKNCNPSLRERLSGTTF